MPRNPSTIEVDAPEFANRSDALASTNGSQDQTSTAETPSPSSRRGPVQDISTQESSPSHQETLETRAYAPTEDRVALRRRQVERELEQADGYDRDDLLVMFGKSASASGRFARAAAAYELFLEEFGFDHGYSPAIALKLGDCLAPLDLRGTGIDHTPSGPEFRPQWLMRYIPSEEMTRRAVGAYEQAALIAETDSDAAQALLKLGWVHRVLGDWEASTDAWKRCASIVTGTKEADDALLCAAENLELTGHSPEAADMFRSLSELSDNPQRAQLAAAKASDLEFLSIRESAVCMAKGSARSTRAAERARESLALAEAAGNVHDIDDARIRMCETETFLCHYRAASTALEELQVNWSRMGANLRTITTKLAARLQICLKQEGAALESIERGSALADAQGLEHQRYHFKRMSWQLEACHSDPRFTILT